MTDRHVFLILRLLAGVSMLVLAMPASAQQSSVLSPHGEISAEISCQDCHSSQSWSPMREDAPFDHGFDTGFPLLAAHETVQCINCHEALVFADPALDGDACQSCHVDVHDGKLAANCATCHNERSFTEVDGFRIHQDSDFPLLGSHEVIACESCHNDNHGGLYFSDALDCASCHQDAYDNTTILPHAENGFSLDCETCHTQFVWPDAIFPDHALLANGFELIGAHEFAGCESCHTSPGYELIFDAAGQNDCIACHRSDYDEEHAGSGTPYECLLCHNTNDWDDTRRFDHDATFFPIYSGTHRGEWNGCVDCHQAAPVMTSFTCVSCHEHSQDRMDREHDDVRGYIFDSAACLSCHPDGREDDD